MTTLHIIPENARSTARLLTQQAGQAQAELDSLRSRLNQLQSAWQGGASDQFHAESGQLMRQLEAQIDQLAVLTTRLQREVDEWELVDQRGAAAFRSNGSGLWGGTLPSAAGGVLLPALAVPVWVSSWLDGLPDWLRNWVNRFFPPVNVPDPLGDSSGKTKLGELLEQDPVTPPPAPPADSQPQKSGFGDLLEPDAVSPATNEVPLPAAPVPETAAAPVDTPPPVYDSYHAVPVKSQGALYGSAACAPTSVSMVLDYFHAQDAARATASPEALIKMLDTGDGTPGSGVSLHLMNDDLAELGYNNVTVGVNAGMETLETHLKDGPVIVTAGVKLIGGENRDIQQAGGTIHAMVVKGMNADSVVLNDPWSGAEKVFSRATFEAMWSRGQQGFYAIRP